MLDATGLRIGRRRRVSVEDLGSRELSDAPPGGVSFEGAKLSSGSTLLNLACSGDPRAALIPGRYYLFVGDSSSGKTVLCTGILAEACQNPVFDEYELFYDDVERGNNLLGTGLFGSKLPQRMKAPQYDEGGEPVHSESIEQFYDNLQRKLDGGKPFVYILDSMDCLTSEQEEAKARSDLKDREDGKDRSGIMTDGKAKINSQRLRNAVRRLEEHGSILIIVCQTRDNLGMGDKKVRSGGRALRFYNTLEMWTSRVETLQQVVLGKKRQIGIQVEVHVKKNRLRGWEPKIQFPIFHSYGVDDLGSLVDYLLEEGVWKKAKGESKIKGEGLPEEGMTREKLLEMADGDPGMRKGIREAVLATWNLIAEKSRVDRSPRYA